jgi:hypothetical protein
LRGLGAGLVIVTSAGMVSISRRDAHAWTPRQLSPATIGCLMSILQLVFGAIDLQPILAVSHGYFQIAIGDLDILLAQAKEAAYANNRGIDLAVGANDQVVDLADLILVFVVHALIVNLRHKVFLIVRCLRRCGRRSGRALRISSDFRLSPRCSKLENIGPYRPLCRLSVRSRYGGDRPDRCRCAPLEKGRRHCQSFCGAADYNQQADRPTDLRDLFEVLGLTHYSVSFSDECVERTVR